MSEQRAQLGFKTPKLYPSARKSFSRSADVVTFATFLLARSTVSRSVPLNWMNFPAGTLLLNPLMIGSTNTDLF